MQFNINRDSKASLRHQLIVQIKLKILAGELGDGHKLPSVRALARRLKIHSNTVAAAYRELGLMGNVVSGRGVGVFTRGVPAKCKDDASFEDLLHAALQAAVRRGLPNKHILAAAARWLATSVPDRIAVIDPFIETAELLRGEIQLAMDVPVVAYTLSDVVADTSLLTGALAVTLPFYADRVRSAAPKAFVVDLRLEDWERKVFDTPAGARVVFVSHSPRLFPYATALFHAVHGDRVSVDCQTLGPGSGCERLARGADVVFADLVTSPIMRDINRNVIEVRLLTPETIAEVRIAARAIRRGAGTKQGPTKQRPTAAKRKRGG
jgi:DNA-binding transcriptional regulator YhcF (GntR family)